MVRRELFKIFVLVLLLAALAFASAPWFAFRALQAAARDGDAAALAELIDFRAVRASLRDQLRAEQEAAEARARAEAAARRPANAPPPSIWQDPIGAMRRALEPLAEQAPQIIRPAPPVVDGYLTPQAIHDLTRGYEPGEAPPAPPPPQGLGERIERLVETPRPRLRFWGVNRARFAAAPKSEPDAEVTFTFAREGWFTWRVVQIRLPGEAPAASATPAAAPAK